MNDPENRREVLDWQLVLVSIAGFWIFHFAVVSLRAGILEFPAQGEIALRRFYVTALGFALTVFYWLVIRLVDTRGMRARVGAAMLAAVPIAVAIAAANYYVFNIYDPATLFDVESKPAEMRPTALQEIADGAVTRYFFLIAWASFYLALNFARESGLAERRAAQFARVAQTAELRALRYQVNPHFLFNTLNSLSALVMKGETTLADAMIMNLSTFYRTSLAGEPTEDVLLTEEIELQKLYLEIETVRFPKRLVVNIDVPDKLDRAAVPGLILQPLVENAIKHGVSSTTSAVTLTIAARAVDGRLVLTVDNSGPNAMPHNRNAGIGLTNVQDRLRARFGSAAWLEHGAKAGGGYLANVTVPLVIVN